VPDATGARRAFGVRWHRGCMGIMKKAGALAVAKKVYDEARKPHNQAKIKSAMSKVQERRRRTR
jgi:hypothetical protein